MADDKNAPKAPPPQSAPPPAAPDRHPDPPRYRPDKALIGYVEKGQKSPAPPAQPPSEKHG
jgi:hypothetical protein